MDSYHEVSQPSFNIYFVILEQDTNVHYTYMAIYFGHKCIKSIYYVGFFLLIWFFKYYVTQDSPGVCVALYYL